MVCSLLGLSVWPASAAGAVDNRQATRLFLEAQLAVSRTEGTGYATDVTVLNALTARIAAECPDVAAGAREHEGTELQDMEVEYATVVLMLELAPKRHELARFVSIGPSLRWSSRRLTSLAHRIVSVYSELLLPVPNLCADWKAWVASGYATVPSDTQRFLHEIPALEASYGEGEGESYAEEALHLLAPYEDRADRQVAAEIEHPAHHETAAQMEAVGYAAESVAVEFGLQERSPNAHP
jgi:hypothetical protein